MWYIAVRDRDLVSFKWSQCWLQRCLSIELLLAALRCKKCLKDCQQNQMPVELVVNARLGVLWEILKGPCYTQFCFNYLVGLKERDFTKHLENNACLFIFQEQDCLHVLCSKWAIWTGGRQRPLSDLVAALPHGAKQCSYVIRYLVRAFHLFD